MKKLILLLCCVLLLCCSCAKADLTDLPEVLLTIDGENLLTRTDLRFAAEYTGEPDTEVLFLTLAEQALLAWLAEQEGENEDFDAIRSEYALYLENLALYGQKNAHDSLRGSLNDLSSEAFDSAFMQYLYRSASADALVTSIASVYGNISDPETIREGITINLCEMLSAHEITVAYPGLEQHYFRFEYAL